MKLKRTREKYYVFASPEDTDVSLEMVFYFSKDKAARVVSAENAHESNGVLDIEVRQTHSADFRHPRVALDQDAVAFECGFP
jgi:hypothetical protein